MRRLSAATLACALVWAASPAMAHGAAATAAHLPAPALAAAQGDPAARARAEARDVLSQRRFRPTSLPTPLRSLRERIGEALRPIGRPFEAAYRWLADGPRVLWVLLAALVLAGAALIAARAGARRAAAAAGREGAGEGAGGDRERLTALDLRRQAEAAERRGELDAALRLRFRAGLIELDSRNLIELRPALTNSELLRAVPSPTLAELVAGFEAVAYGGRPAGEEDLRSARDGWPRVAGEVGVGAR